MLHLYVCQVFKCDKFLGPNRTLFKNGRKTIKLILHTALKIGILNRQVTISLKKSTHFMVGHGDYITCVFTISFRNVSC